MNAQIAPNHVNDSPLKLHMASAFGALFVGIGDYLMHGHSSLTIKIGEMFFPGFNYPLISFLVLMFLASIASWVHPCQTKLDAFKGGVAVLGFIMGIVPNPQGDFSYVNKPSLPDKPKPSKMSDTGALSLHSLFLIREVYAETGADENAASQAINPKNGVILRDPNAPEKKIDAFLLLRDQNKMEIVGKGYVNGGIVLQQQPGTYFLDIEAEGYRSVRYPIEFKASTGEKPDAESQTVITLEKYKVPMFLQRLIPPAMVDSPAVRGGALR